MERMTQIMGGKSKKCPNSKENLTSIAAEFGKDADIVHKILINIDLFTPENRKHLIDIFRDLMELEVDVNPLVAGLAHDVENTILTILEKFETSGMSTYYADILKQFAINKHLVGKFLNVKIFELIAKYSTNAVFNSSSESLSILEEILQPENVTIKKMVSDFLNEFREEVMEIILNILSEDAYLARRKLMQILNFLLHDKEYNKEFSEYFVKEKNHLKMVMTSLNDESPPIQREAFELMLFFLKVPHDKRGHKVNDTIRKNKETLLSFFEHFGQEKEDEGFQAKIDYACKLLNEIPS
jgi:hypothetical protein